MPSLEDLATLDGLSRDELIARARSLGARRPELMTRVELRDEIVRLTESDPVARKRSRGWLGVARDLVASVVDAGLNLPGAAAAIRGGAKPEPEWHGPAPVATLTLAEIYVAQGHTERALKVLDEVLQNEPDHGEARALRERLTSERGSRPRAVEPVVSTPTLVETTSGEPGETASGGRDEIPVPVVSAAPAESPEAAMTLVPEDESAAVAPPVCAIAVSERGLAVRYELEAPTDAATLRVVSFLPRREGPERLANDVPLDGLETSGGLALPPPPAGAVVRAALGTGSDGGFKPLAVAWIYQAEEAELTLRFAPPGREPRALRSGLLAALRTMPAP